MTKRNRRTFTEEFKKQIVQLYEAGNELQGINMYSTVHQMANMFLLAIRI
ncbi:transposase [Terribacillus sp. DMT04]|nr:transposase [Terribacillus sp. DMT04]QXE02508.1 transposase [Terribacillus sp. DMT04]